MKRIMPRARGTAYPIKRRYSHIHVTLWDGEPDDTGDDDGRIMVEFTFHET